MLNTWPGIGDPTFVSTLTSWASSPTGGMVPATKRFLAIVYPGPGAYTWWDACGYLEASGYQRPALF